jgi:hypothetical protein
LHRKPCSVPLSLCIHNVSRYAPDHNPVSRTNGNKTVSKIRSIPASSKSFGKQVTNSEFMFHILPFVWAAFFRKSNRPGGTVPARHLALMGWQPRLFQSV